MNRFIDRFYVIVIKLATRCNKKYKNEFWESYEIYV